MVKKQLEFKKEGLEIVENPDKNITFAFERLTLKKNLPEYWKKEEIDKIIESIDNYKIKFLAQFLWMSGVRITEAVSIKKSDIDFQHYIISIVWQKNKKYAERNIPIHPRLRDMLQVYTANLNLDDYIFPFSRQHAWRYLKKYTGGKPHKFRHSFAIHWLWCHADDGGDIATLSRILGHSGLRTTMTYLQIAPVDQGKGMLKMNYD